MVTISQRFRDPRALGGIALVAGVITLIALVASIVAGFQYWQSTRTDILLRSAREQTQALEVFRSYFSDHIVEESSNIATTDHQQVDAHARSSATGTGDTVADKLSEEGLAARFSLISEFPFAWRTTRVLDDFDQRALTALSKGSNQEFYELIDQQSGAQLHYAHAVKMEASCVSCHNGRPDTPRVGWKVGDIAGIQRVVLPVPSLMPTKVSQVAEIAGSLGLLLVSTLALLTVMGRRSRLAYSELEQTAKKEKLRRQELSRANRAVEASQRFTRVVVDNVVEGIVAFDELGMVLRVNPGACRLFGRSSAEVVGQPIGDLLSDSLRGELGDDVGAFIRDNKSKMLGLRHELAIPRRNGELIDVRLIISEIEVDGKTQFVASLHDISELKKHETSLREALAMAKSSSRAKSRFLAMMSHEIRTPLNAVVNLNDIVLETELNTRQRHLIKTARDSGLSLSQIINDILDFSRIEAGEMTLNAKPFDLHALIAGVEQLFASTASSKSLRFEVNTDATVPRFIVGDASRVRQVLVNLVGNALKFTQQGYVLAHITLGGKEGSLLSVRVEDSGPGVEPGDRDRLFADFTQIERSQNSSGVAGTGLGLAISRRLCGLMGGRIDFEPSLVGGSVFFFELPFEAPSTVELSTLAGDPVEKVLPTNATGRVLVAEDSETNRLVTRMLLDQAGYESTMVNDGAQAVELALSSSFDIILMDVSMPIMDGYEATRTLRERGYTGPIIALSAFAFNEDVDRAMAQGMDGYVRKPIDKHQLFDEIERVLSRGDERLPQAVPAMYRRFLSRLQTSLSPSVLASIVEPIEGQLQQHVDGVERALNSASEDDLDASQKTLASFAMRCGFDEIERASQRISRHLQLGEWDAVTLLTRAQLKSCRELLAMFDKEPLHEQKSVSSAALY
ncbi:response regulator [Gammaproteobacteria bacterium]|nr:response regulator [Gammaproteobacteria bacterium]